MVWTSFERLFRVCDGDNDRGASVYARSTEDIQAVRLPVIDFIAKAPIVTEFDENPAGLQPLVGDPTQVEILSQ